jgi:hypothetical protein
MVDQLKILCGTNTQTSRKDLQTRYLSLVCEKIVAIFLEKHLPIDGQNIHNTRAKLMAST